MSDERASDTNGTALLATIQAIKDHRDPVVTPGEVAAEIEADESEAREYLEELEQRGILQGKPIGEVRVYSIAPPE